MGAPVGVFQGAEVLIEALHERGNGGGASEAPLQAQRPVELRQVDERHLLMHAVEGRRRQVHGSRSPMPSGWTSLPCKFGR
jgi:hypothetical protein